MIDQQIKRPVCERCKEKDAVTRVYEMWVCLWCLDKISKKIKENQRKWVQE